MLQEIIARGDEDHKQIAFNTLIHTERLRGHRQILNRYDLSDVQSNGEYRIIYNATNRQSLPGKVVRKEGESLTGDVCVDEAYTFTGNTWQFYNQVFKRDGIDGKGGKIICSVHYGKDFDNAFWNGEQMVFGDGDGKIFQRFTKCLEVIGHELTHGVTESHSSLTYQGQSGAVNEAMSDVMGSLVKQFTLNQDVHEANWIIGDGLFEPSINGVGIRSLAAPGTAYDDPLLGKDPCPASMKDYVHTQQDNGGIHINCTIASHAFYISALEIGGFAWQKPGRVWYVVDTKRMKSQCSFTQLADMTLKAAAQIFGNNSLVEKAIHKGWTGVGVI